MSRPNAKDRQEAIRRYVEDETPLRTIADKLGFSFTWAHKTIKNAGVMRTKREAQRISKGKEDKMQLALSFVTDLELSVHAAAKKAGVSANGLRRRMLADGVELPGMSEAVSRVTVNQKREEWVLTHFHPRKAMRFVHKQGMSPERIAKAWRVRLEVAERILKEAS